MNTLKDEVFAELIASVKEGGAILRDEKEAARTFPRTVWILNVFAQGTT